LRVLLIAGLLAAVVAAAAPAAGDPEGDIVERGESDTEIALTFDEYLGEDTRPILRILRRHDAEATFFQIGKEIKANPELAERIVRSGHELANHSWNHKDMTTVKRPAQSLRRTQRAAAAISGEEPTLFRPPFKLYDDRLVRIAKRQGMKTVLFSFAAMDWTLPPEYIEPYVIDNVVPGDIVLFHQVRNTREALPGIMRWMDEEGYEAVTVTELLD
jgi:peptidoglycan/xylan/chitin deacetylase (PgdA/CDA1 family)